MDDTPGNAKLTLIHAKGSGSEKEDREISVPDYEVVVGQAVKNLRHVDRGLLREKLKANGNGVLRTAVWQNGIRQEDRTGFLASLDAIGSDMTLEVVVFQPRFREAEISKLREKMRKGEKNHRLSDYNS